MMSGTVCMCTCYCKHCFGIFGLIVCISDHKTTASFIWLKVFSACVVLDSYYYQMWPSEVKNGNLKAFEQITVYSSKGCWKLPVQKLRLASGK